jgi:hypothetical protein
MYLEVSYPSKLLYSIYIPVEKYNVIQPIIIHNLFYLYGIEVEVLGSIPAGHVFSSAARNSHIRKSIRWGSCSTYQ